MRVGGPRVGLVVAVREVPGRGGRGREQAERAVDVHPGAVAVGDRDRLREQVEPPEWRLPACRTTMIGEPSGSGRARLTGHPGRSGPGHRLAPVPARRAPGSAGPGRRCRGAARRPARGRAAIQIGHCSATSQPTRCSAASRAAARQVKFDIVAPVTKPTPLVSGRPRMSSSQALVTSSTAACAGRRAQHRVLVPGADQPVRGQGGRVGAADHQPVKPAGRHCGQAGVARAREQVDHLVRGRRARRERVPSSLMTSVTEARAGTGRVARLSSQRFAWRAAWSSAMYRSVMLPVLTVPRGVAPWDQPT